MLTGANEMVGATGIEPVTPTMSTDSSSVKPLRYKGCSRACKQDSPGTAGERPGFGAQTARKGEAPCAWPRQTEIVIFIDMTVDHRSAERACQFRNGIAAIPEIVSCHVVSGKHRMFAQVVVPELSAYGRLLCERLLQLPGVTNMDSFVSLRRLK